MNPLALFAGLIPALTDASAQWSEAMERIVDPEPVSFADAEPNEDRSYRVVDIREEAKRVRYQASRRRKALGLPGRIKRTAYAPVDITKRRVVLVIHQMGVVRSLARLAQRARLVTAQEVWAADGTVYIVHPDETRLIAANRFDRDPYHSINFEFAGNFEGVAGSGRFYKPELFGRSVMTDAWALAAAQRLTDKIIDLRSRGVEPFMVAPHRVAGHDDEGNPNRQICCGSAQWKIAERVAAEMDIAVPGPDYEIGGLTIPEDWRSEAFSDCRTVKAA